MEPVLGGGPGLLGSSGQGGHVMGQEKPASQAEESSASEKEGIHECKRRTI